jgi:hypothetical protein
MANQAFNTAKKSILQRNYGSDIASRPIEDTERPRKTGMKISPVITNLCILLMVMALLAVCFRL